MIKKMIVFIGVLFSFFLMFLFGFNKINILAYIPINNTIGTYPLQLDIDNYNTYNLYDYNLVCGSTSNNATCELVDNGVSINVDVINNNGGVVNSVVSPVITDLLKSLKKDTNYTLSYKLSGDTETFRFIGIFDQYATFLYRSDRDTHLVINDNNFNSNYRYTLVLYLKNGSSVGSVLNLSEIMLYEGDYNSNIPYSKPFKFGFIVGYTIYLRNDTSTNQTTDVQIRNENNDVLFTNSVTISANSGIVFSPNSYFYLPFNIDNKGNISFNYKLKLFVTNTNLKSGGSIGDTGIQFVFTYNAYYKGEYTNKLHFKNNYLFNNVFLQGIQLTTTSFDNTLENSYIYFYKTNFDNEYFLNSRNNGSDVEISYNIATNKLTETGYYKDLDFGYFNDTDNEIYYFLVYALNNPSSSLPNNMLFNINISSLSSRIVGNDSISPPTNDNPIFSNKYNSCDAWYDIPCQLGNGLTYVIYEAPIISPVLTFVFSFITMFSSLVSFVDLFSSFGIVFGCFVFYMFIELLHKYSK